MPEKEKKFQQLIDISMEFAHAKDVDFLLEKILGTARRLANADVGSIYIVENGMLRYHHTQNGTPRELTTSEDNHLYQKTANELPADSLPAYVARTDEVITLADISQLDQDAPYHHDRSYEQQTHAQATSVLAFSLKTPQGKSVGAIQLVNCRDDHGQPIATLEEDLPLIQLFANNAANAIERTQATRARVLGIIQILTALRDTEETVAHVNRVGAYSSAIYETWAHKKGIPAQEISAQKDILRMAAMLHDVGKLAIPAVIRTKPGRLNEDEYNTMKEHTVKGAQLLLKHGSSEIEEVAAQIALTHHERWDGQGYPGHIDPYTGDAIQEHKDAQGKPYGKKEEEIPAFGRVVAIADVYDALSNHRVFREAWKEEDVLNKLKEESGRHFDPEMIDAFFSILDTLRSISETVLGLIL